MKKILAILLAILMVVCLSACGNYDLWDTEYTFDKAIVKFPDGTVETLEIKNWTDYDGEQLQITTKDGIVYVFNSVNCVLVKEADE